jgi:hypothetical protein
VENGTTTIFEKITLEHLENETFKIFYSLIPCILSKPSWLWKIPKLKKNPPELKIDFLSLSKHACRSISNEPNKKKQ